MSRGDIIGRWRRAPERWRPILDGLGSFRWPCEWACGSILIGQTQAALDATVARHVQSRHTEQP